MNDLMSKEISLDFSDPKIIALFVMAIAAGVVLLAFFLIFIKSGFKVARLCGTSLFNIFNILMFGFPIALYMLIPFFTEHIFITIILLAVMWAIPILINIRKCAIKYGIIISVFQIFFGFLLSAVVHTIAGLIVFAAGLIVCYFVFGPEMFDMIIVLPDGRSIGVVKTGKNSCIDSKGNSYYYDGYKWIRW